VTAQEFDLQSIQYLWNLVKYLLTPKQVNNILLFATVLIGWAVWSVAKKKGNLWALDFCGIWLKMC